MIEISLWLTPIDKNNDKLLTPLHRATSLQKYHLFAKEMKARFNKREILKC